MSASYTIQPIGYLQSPYRQKFGVPRQPGLVDCEARLVLDKQFSGDSVRGLEAYSHLWLSFLFHQTVEQGWQPLVRPPRAGGNQKLGVFATRSSFRPNGLGLSVVELKGIELGKQVSLILSGVDLVDGTPIIDIKPYIPYADSQPQARADFAPAAPAMLAVHWRDAALQQAQQLQVADTERRVIEQVLAQDPRPAYHATDPNKRYGVWLYQWDIAFSVDENGVWIDSLELRP